MNKESGGRAGYVVAGGQTNTRMPIEYAPNGERIVSILYSRGESRSLF